MNCQSCSRLIVVVLPLCWAALLAGGCARIPNGVQVVSARDKHKFSEKYQAAFVSRGNGGDYNIVLLKDAASRPILSTGGPIKPLELSDVRQLLRIHIFWRPMRGTKADSPSATNAAIDWYLVRAGADGKITGLAHYEGAGLVTAQIDEDTAAVIIRSGALRPSRVEGDLSDPIGTSKITGRFDAIYRPTAVSGVLEELQKLERGVIGGEVDAVRLTEPAAASVRTR